MQPKRPLAQRLPWLILVFLVASGLAYAFWPRAVRVDLATVALGPMEVTVDEDGKTRIRERYVVSAPLSGQLQRIELEPGDPVDAQKTVLAVIEPPPAELLNPRARLEAESRVQAAEALLSSAAARRDAAQEALELSVHNLERVKVLYNRHTITREEFDATEYRQRILASELRSAEFAEKVAEHELNLSKASLARFDVETPGSAERWELRSPVSGRVLRVLQESATHVDAGDQLPEVGDPTDLEVEVDLLSADAVQVRPGARVTLEAWGGERPLDGRVRYVEPAAYLKISALGIEEQRVNVIIDLVEPLETRQRLGDAYRVEAKITVWESPSVLQIPIGALFRRGDDWAVFLVEDGRAQLRTITIGRTNGLMAAVESGLQATDQVVLHPADNLMDGARVTARR